MTNSKCHRCEQDFQKPRPFHRIPIMFGKTTKAGTIRNPKTALLLYCHPDKTCYDSCLAIVEADPTVQTDLLDVEARHRNTPSLSQSNRTKQTDHCVRKHVAYPCVTCGTTIYSTLQIGERRVLVPQPSSGHGSFSCGEPCTPKQMGTRKSKQG